MFSVFCKFFQVKNTLYRTDDVGAVDKLNNSNIDQQKAQCVLWMADGPVAIAIRVKCPTNNESVAMEAQNHAFVPNLSQSR